MHYLIDGYNLLFTCCKEIEPLEKSRERLIEFLQKRAETRALSLSVIFDSGQEEGTPFPAKKILSRVTLLFSPTGLSADQYMLEWLRFQKNRSQITLVTSDKQLSQQASNLGVKVESAEEFWRFLSRKKRGRPSDEKMGEETAEEKARLLREFTQRENN